ncbi:MAG: PQQ-binding-like beta-propeller repeat protein [bacterium]
MIEYKKMNRAKRMIFAGVMLFLFLVVPATLAGEVFAFSFPPAKGTVEAPKAVSRFDAPPVATDWPTFHGDVARSGASAEKYIMPPLSIRWGFSTGGNIWSSPAVVAKTLFIGSSDGKLYSLDVLDGSMRWAFKTGNAIFSSPAIEKGTVYFGSSDHLLYALDAESGLLKWAFETGDPVTSSPAVLDGVVYFGSWDGFLYALATDGRLKWQYQTGGAVYSSPALSRGKVFFGSSDGKIYALDAEKGTPVWVFQTDDYISSTPTISGKIVYVGSWDGNMYALSSDDGKLLWKFRTGAGIYSSPAVFEDTIIFGSYDSKLYCLDKYKGILKWSYYSKDSVYHSSPVVANGVVYVGLGYKNKVQAFNARTGEYLWSSPTGASVGASPAISETNMYIAASDGKIYAFGDIEQPDAKVDTLKPAFNKYDFLVSWTGVDKGGSGISSYDIQFRTGAGEYWQNWLTGVTTTSAIFGPYEPIEVRDTTVYYFQARAHDNAGNSGDYAGGDGDTHTGIDLTPPRIRKVSINNVQVQTGSFINSKPLIQASISDNVSVDPDSLRVYIDTKEFTPDSFINGLMKYKHKAPISPGKHNIMVIAADVSGNKAEPWEIKGIRVSEGIEAADISAFPTPFNPLAGPVYISYRLNANAETNIFIYDKYGSLICSMKFEEKENGGKRGWNKIAWNGVTGSDSIVGNGEYFFKIVANRNLVGKGQIVVQK